MIHNRLADVLLAGLIMIQAMAFTSCSDNDDTEYAPVDPVTGKGLFIVNEGAYNGGNASLSFYDTTAGEVANGVFARANGAKLGDGAQSMTINGQGGWIVVGNSGVIFDIDIDTYRERGRVTGLTSPRNICFINDSTAYVTQLWDCRIAIVDARRHVVKSYINVEGMSELGASTEAIVLDGDYAYVACWSYNKMIVKIDTRTDRIVAKLEVGIQPESMTMDCNGLLWVLCDGGSWAENPAGYEAPTLVAVNPETFMVVRRLTMNLGDYPTNLVSDGTGRNLYWINNGIWRMDADATALPQARYIAPEGMAFYGLTVNPVNGDIYASDAVDYSQNGTVYRYGADGALISSFTAGIIPGSFCWK